MDCCASGMAACRPLSHSFTPSSTCLFFLRSSSSRSSLGCRSTSSCSSSSLSSDSYLFPDSQFYPYSPSHTSFPFYKSSLLCFSRTNYFPQWPRYTRIWSLEEKRGKGERRMAAMASLYRFGSEGRVEDTRGFEGRKFPGEIAEDNVWQGDKNTFQGERATWTEREYDISQENDSGSWQGKAYETLHGDDSETWQGGPDTWQENDSATWRGRNSRRRRDDTWQMEDDPWQRRKFDAWLKKEREENSDEYPWPQNRWSVFFKFVFSLLKQSMAVLETRIHEHLPSPVPHQLISVAVKGGLVLTVLWLIKSLLVVLFTVGKTVFTLLLLISSFLAIGNWISRRDEGENKKQKTTETRRRRRRSTNETDFDGLYRNQNYGYS